jgi:hypothetical protein
MKYGFLPLIPILLMFSCKHGLVKEYFYKTGELKSKQIYPDKRDTLNFQQLDFYPTGEVLRKSNIKNGKQDGEYLMYHIKGNILERGRFLNGKLDGIFQKYDTVGKLATESYFTDGTRILHSIGLTSNDGKLEKQLFHIVFNDSIYPIGALVKKGATIQKDLSQYALIIAEDSISTLEYCLKLQIFKDQTPKTVYEITFGTPDKKLEFTKVDTSFVSTSNEIQICNLKLLPGLNHIFSRIFVYDDDTASFFVYKDIFVKGPNEK